MERTNPLGKSIKKQAVKPKHIPQRSCIACRDKRDKLELIRLVCNNLGSIEVDVEKKVRGRGAYLCPAYECWEIALKKNRLEYALRTNLKSEDRQLLLEYAKGLPLKEEIQK